MSDGIPFNRPQKHVPTEERRLSITNPRYRAAETCAYRRTTTVNHESEIQGRVRESNGSRQGGDDVDAMLSLDPSHTIYVLIGFRRSSLIAFIQQLTSMTVERRP